MNPLNIVVINYSGNTGKTTLSKHLLAPQIFKAKRIQIEDINSADGLPDMQIGASQSTELLIKLSAAREGQHCVIDIGASNAKKMMEYFAKSKVARTAISFWVIPVVPASKQIADSLKTLSALLAMGVDADKVIFIPNNVVDTGSVQHDFKAIYSAGKELGVHVCIEVVLQSEIFELIKDQPQTVFDMVASTPDFPNLIKAARIKDDPSELNQLALEQVLHDMADYTSANLTAVFMDTPIAELVTAS